MTDIDGRLKGRFASAVEAMDRLFKSNPSRLEDDNTDPQLREWLDGDLPPLEWAEARVTADEWFFITTLYGEMTRAGQRAHIRAFFPRFVREAGRNIRNFTPQILEPWKLRSRWMKGRLCRMAKILQDRDLTMDAYAAQLRELEKSATPENPSPALDAIIRDHRASGWKTLSVFIRDCVRGNCFPIDSRVAKELSRHQLPSSVSDEDLYVRLSVALGRSPRTIARMFYESGGENAVFG